MVYPKLIPVSRHEKNLRQLKCIVSHRTPVTLHHCHGGSMKEVFINPGMGQRACPYLQIPLHANYHIGEFGIDTGMGTTGWVAEWERTFGRQIDHLTEVSGLLGYDVIQSAKLWIEQNNRRLILGRRLNQ